MPYELTAHKVNSFLKVAERTANKPALALPHNMECAKAFCRICDEILEVNENMLLFFERFSLFRLTSETEVHEFNELVIKYRAIKDRNLRGLKIQRHNIERNYFEYIKRHLPDLFDNNFADVDEVEGVFTMIMNTGEDMITYVAKDIIGRIDLYLYDVMFLLDANNLMEAQRKRLEFNKTARSTRDQLQKLNDTLTDLVLKYADLAGVICFEDNI